MALKNLTSDLSDYFKKEPSKQTGRFQKPDRSMSELDVHGKLETYQRPEIQKDLSGKPIIPTNFDQPDISKRYSDNFESKLVKLASVDITQNSLQGRFETSPVTVNEISISGKNETSRYDPEQTNPKGRNEESGVVIPNLDPTGRFSVSGVDPVLSVLKGRFETSDLKPVQSILNGRHATTDSSGIEIVPDNNDILISKTTTFGIQNSDEEGPALYQLGKAVKFNGSLVDINDSDSHTFSERPIKASGALPYSSLLDTIGTSPDYSTSLNTVIGSSFSIQGNTISSDIIQQNIQYEGMGGEEYWATGPNVLIDQPIRFSGTNISIDYFTEQYDKILTKFVTDFATIGFTEPDNATVHNISSISALNVAPDTYTSQLITTPLNFTIPFNATDPNSVMANFGYDIINTAISNSQGQTYTVVASSNSPLQDVTISGLHVGGIESLMQNNPSVFGLDMVQSFTVLGNASVISTQEVTITGQKNSFDPSTLSNSQTISTSLFGGKTMEQIGSIDPLTTATISLADQLATGLNFREDIHAVGFTPNMVQNFSPAGEEGSKFIGISGGEYDRGGLDSTYSHKTIYESAFGTELNPGMANIGITSPIAYDQNNHLTPGTLRTFNLNQTTPINYISETNGILDFASSELSAKLGAKKGGQYVHRLGPYGMDTTVTVTATPAEMTTELPPLYNNGLGVQQYGVPVGKKPTSYQTNFDDNKIGEGVRYGDFILNKLRSGDDEKWYESAFPMFSGKNISSAKVGVGELKKMMKRKKTFRIWENHNSYTLQGNQGLHKGLEHFGIVSGGSSLLDGWFPEFTNIAVAGNTTANRYYSVLGYPGLMVAQGLADSGAVSHADFRALINDPLAVFYGDPNISNYSSNNLVSRGGSYNQGRTGLARRDYRQATSKAKPYGGDAITQQSITGVDIKSMEQEYGDLIKFYIKDPIKGNTLRFRSYITAINDSLGATWTGVKYIGRPNNLFLYEGASDRKLSFSLKVAALSRYDVIHMWKKVNYLTSLCYPHVNENTGQMIGPVVGLTLGDWFQDEPGFFDSVNITVDTSSPWEINLEDARYAKNTLGDQLLDSAMKGGISGLVNTGITKIKDAVKSTVLNKSIDDKGQQVAQLPHVIDITLGFTSMASSNRTVGGDMFGAFQADGSWTNGDPGFPKASLLDKALGGKTGAFAGSGVGKALGSVLGRF